MKNFALFVIFVNLGALQCVVQNSQHIILNSVILNNVILNLIQDLFRRFQIKFGMTRKVWNDEKSLERREKFGTTQNAVIVPFPV